MVRITTTELKCSHNTFSGGSQFEVCVFLPIHPLAVQTQVLVNNESRAFMVVGKVYVQHCKVLTRMY